MKKPINILLIDDHPFTLEAYEAALTQLSTNESLPKFNIQTAYDYDSALLTINESINKKDKIDIITLDISFGSTANNELYNENTYEIENNLSFKNKAEYYSLLKEFNQDNLMIYSGGIIQTIMIGTISFIILLFKKSKNKPLLIIDWILVFLSLFWLREVFILLSGIIIGFVYNKGSFFNGDEAYVSSLLGIYKGSLSLILGVIGILISSYIAFKIIPKKIRLSFIAGGAIGSFIGFFIWMNIVGPYLLP